MFLLYVSSVDRGVRLILSHRETAPLFPSWLMVRGAWLFDLA